MRKKAKKEIKSIDDIEVKLRPLGKVRPGIYLTVLYACIIALLVFFFLFLPGLRKHGAEVAFVSVPNESSVYVDGELAGITPFTAFISSGKRKIEFKKLNFEAVEKVYTVPGRLFGSLIFPKKEAVSARLRIESGEKLLQSAFIEYANWSGLDNFHSRYQPPPVLSETVRAVHMAEGDIDKEKLVSFLTGCMEYSGSEPLLKDLVRAYLLTITEGKPLTSQTMTSALREISSIFDNFPNLPFWMAVQLSQEKVENLTRNQWYIGRLRAYEQVLQNAAQDLEAGTSERDHFFPEGMSFAEVPGGTYPLGDVTKNSFPVLYTTDSFYIAADEVSYILYGDFLEENPSYRPENRENLVKEGKVSEDYLKEWDIHGGSNLPVAYVSYYAASAYCSWLEDKLPARMRERYTVRLPLEYEWEAAAFQADTADPVLFETGISGPRPVGTGGSSIQNMYGNLWEWCDNWYGVNNFVYYDWSGNYKNKAPYPSLEKSVRGGSWGVMQELVTIQSRGSQPAQWCTPFLGFRPVIVQK